MIRPLILALLSALAAGCNYPTVAPMAAPVPAPTRPEGDRRAPLADAVATRPEDRP